MKSDDRGILSLPMKLTVAVLIVTVMTPLVVGMVGNAEDRISTLESETDARILSDGISRAFYGGVGTSVTVTLSIPVYESMEIGGGGADAYAIRLISGGVVRDRILIEKPAVPVLGEAQSFSGEVSLKITCVREDGTLGVTVER